MKTQILWAIKNRRFNTFNFTKSQTSVHWDYNYKRKIALSPSCQWAYRDWVRMSGTWNCERTCRSYIYLSKCKKNIWHYWVMMVNIPSLPLSCLHPFLSCAQLERDNISSRLNSGRKQYVEKCGKLGRPTGST